MEIYVATQRESSCVLACKAQFGDSFAAVQTEQAGGFRSAQVTMPLFAPIGSSITGLVSYLCAPYSFILSISHRFVILPFSHHSLNISNAIVCSFYKLLIDQTLRTMAELLAPVGEREILPKTLKPLHYDLSFEPDLEEGQEFQGSVNIEIQVLAVTPIITLKGPFGCDTRFEYPVLNTSIEYSVSEYSRILVFVFFRPVWQNPNTK